MDRIMYLGEVPVMATSKVVVKDDVLEMISDNYNMEEETVSLYRAAIRACEEESDYGSVEVLQKILLQEEDHCKWLRQELSLVEKVGRENYMLTMSRV